MTSLKWKHGWGKHRAKCPSQFERASKLESWKPLRKYGKRLGWLVGGFVARMAAKEGLPAETSCCKTTDNILIRHYGRTITEFSLVNMESAVSTDYVYYTLDKYLMTINIYNN